MGYTSIYEAKGSIESLSSQLNDRLGKVDKSVLTDQRLMYGNDKSRAALVMESSDDGYNFVTAGFAEDTFSDLGTALTNYLDGFKQRVVGFIMDHSHDRWRAILIYAKNTTVTNNSLSAIKSDGNEDAEGDVNKKLSSTDDLGGFDTLYTNESFYSIVVSVTP